MLVAALGWDGPERCVFRLVRRRKLALATSPPLLDELQRVLCYPRLRVATEDRQRFLTDVRAHIRLVSPTRRVDVIRADAADNRVLECAVTAEVDWIVSGDRHLLELGTFEGIPIETARRLLMILGREDLA